MIKTYGNNTILTKKLATYEFGRSATFKKQAKTLNNKALAAIAEDCLSLRSKRVPQALQVLYKFDTVIRIIFGGAKAFCYFLAHKK